MEKISILLFIAFTLSGCIKQPSIVYCFNYSETVDPSPILSENWDSLNSGLNASIGTINERYLKSSIPKIPTKKNWHGIAWRGERISAQLVLWSKDSIKQIECNFSEFNSSGGNTLPSSIAQVRFVRYVVTDEFGDGCGKRVPEDYTASLSPDVLDPVKCFGIEQQTTRPVWITFEIPIDAIPGTYTSELQINTTGEKHSSFRFTIEILERTLPDASLWKFHLDLWQNPYAVARVHEVEPCPSKFTINSKLPP